MKQIEAKEAPLNFDTLSLALAVVGEMAISGRQTPRKKTQGAARSGTSKGTLSHHFFKKKIRLFYFLHICFGIVASLGSCFDSYQVQEAFEKRKREASTAPT